MGEQGRRELGATKVADLVEELLRLKIDQLALLVKTGQPLELGLQDSAGLRQGRQVGYVDVFRRRNRSEPVPHFRDAGLKIFDEIPRRIENSLDIPPEAVEPSGRQVRCFERCLDPR